MELVAGVAGDGNRPKLLGMLELAMAPALSGEIPPVPTQQLQEVANLHVP
jgi:hypothetical protein